MAEKSYKPRARKPTIFFDSAGHCEGGEVDGPTHLIINMELVIASITVLQFTCNTSLCITPCSSKSIANKFQRLVVAWQLSLAAHKPGKHTL